MELKLFAPLSILFVAACGQFASAPASIKDIEKSYGVVVCAGSDVRITNNLGIAEPAPVYEISFPNDQCVDDFLESVVAAASYSEHPFGDKNKILGSSEKWGIQFQTSRRGRDVTYFVSSFKSLRAYERKH